MAAQVTGFSNLDREGHIDVMFVSPDHQGRGVARTLLTHIETCARDQGIGRLFTEASITARPFFARHGFELIAEQEVPLRGQLFRNFRMSKTLRAE